MAKAARSPSAFPPDDEVLVFDDWKAALDTPNGADMMILDLIAALDEPHKIAGYERFAEAKMTHATAASIPLVLVAAPDDYEMDFMAGWPDFVFAHLKPPVTEKVLRRVSTWL